MNFRQRLLCASMPWRTLIKNTMYGKISLRTTYACMATIYVLHASLWHLMTCICREIWLNNDPLKKVPWTWAAAVAPTTHWRVFQQQPSRTVLIYCECSPRNVAMTTKCPGIYSNVYFHQILFWVPAESIHILLVFFALFASPQNKRNITLPVTHP